MAMESLLFKLYRKKEDYARNKGLSTESSPMFVGSGTVFGLFAQEAKHQGTNTVPKEDVSYI
ncbi:MAG: hypothetical protein Fur0022_32900 [Anaerolineales bacterium]